MADKETGLNITVGAEADVGSAKKAAQDLTKGVLSSLKDGYIEVPAEVKVPIKNASKELEQAQRDVLKQWKKTFKEGFSSSAKDLDDLTEAYRKFKRLAGKEHKAGSKQYKEISKLMGEQIQSYNTQKQAREAKRAEQMAKLEAAKQRKATTKSKRPRKGYTDTGAKITKEEIDSNIKSEQKRRYKGTKSTGPAGYGSGWVDPGRTNEYEAKRSEASSYKSNMARQMRQSEMEARKWAKESLVITKDKELAEKMYQAAKASSKKNAPTAMEKAGQLGEDIRKNILPDLIDKIKASDNDKEIDSLTKKFFDTLETVSKLNQDAGKLIFSDVKKNIGLTMGKLGFTTSGNIGGTEGGDKTDASRDPKMVALLKGLLDKVAEKEDAIKQELIKLEQLEKETTKSSKVTKEVNSFANRIIAETRAGKTAQKQSSEQVAQAVNKDTKAVENNTAYDKIENVAERQADIQLEAEQKATTQANIGEVEELKEDADTGFNTNAKADKLLKESSSLKKILGSEVIGLLQRLAEVLSAFDAKTGIASGMKADLEGAMCPCQDILNQIAQGVKNIDVNVGNVLQGLLSMGAKLPNNLPALIEGEEVKDRPVDKEPIIDKTNIAKIVSEHQSRMVDRDRAEAIIKNAFGKYRTQKQEKEETERATAEKQKQINEAQIPLSNIIASSFKSRNVLDSIKKAFGVATGPNASAISGMNQAELEKLRAERISKFGLTNDDKAGATGDKGRAYRMKSVYGWDKNNKNPFEDLKLSDSLNIDTTKITEALQDVIQKNMFTAQTGGAFRNIIGSMTGYIGMPSLEKSRTQAEGLNEVMAQIRAAAQKILQEIQARETDLRGMQQSGKAVFNDDGTMNAEKSSKEAVKLFGDLEEQKMALRGVLADAAAVDEVVKNTGGNVNKILQQLGFASPELRKCNTILQNINAGLDKNGKALKFQTRTAEVLNYSFQLMARSIGQMIKRWISMLNPINLLKRAFQDFASYDVKWQRTMNVIKYNIRRIIKPAMQWIAQQIVNVIGLVNALMKGIGKVFNKNWDLFDQAAANTEKMEEDFEKINNVTASFDELHDIASETNSSDPAMDLMGDIYKPQWDGLYKVLEDIGELIGKIINAVKDWTFWDWLKLIGAALVGYLALKWLINLFSKGNPLQNVANGLAFLEKAVGWALLIWAFTEFTKALTAFVECMKTADWEDIAKSLVMLGGAFAELVTSILILEKVSKIIGTSASEMVGLAALVWVFGEFVKAVIPFIECIKELIKEGVYWESIGGMLLGLVAAFAALIAGVAGLEKVSAIIGATGGGLLGLAGVVGALSLFVKAVVPFIECIKDLVKEGVYWETISGMVLGLVGAFLALAAGVGAISRTFSTMDWKGVFQLYAVAGVFELFMYTLIPFLYAIKDVPFETLAGGALLISGAFLALGGAVALMAPAVKMLDWSSMFQGLILMAAMAGIIWVLAEFAKSLKDLTGEQIISGLLLLAGGLMAITVAIGALAVIFTAVATTGIGLAAIALLAVVLAAVMGIIYAMAELVRALGEAGEGIKLILEGIATVVESVGTAISTVITAIGGVIIGILTVIGETIIGIISAIAEGASTIISSVAEGISLIISTTAEAIVNIINALATAFETVGQTICAIVETIATAIATTVEAIATGITTVLQPILDFVDSVIGKITELATTIVKEVGETIRDVVKTVGDVIIGIITSITEAIPKLLKAITDFCGDIGPAIEKSADSIMRTITKVINFTVSAIEYLVNLVIGGVNGIISAINSVSQYVGINIPRVPEVNIPRFVPQYKTGTNFVPNDQLAYLHKGEAVIPAKYNQGNAYQQNDTRRLENSINQLNEQVARIGNTVQEGIQVQGQFVQKGTDLVASVERSNNKLSNAILSNKVYAR